MGLAQPLGLSLAKPSPSRKSELPASFHDLKRVFRRHPAYHRGQFNQLTNRTIVQDATNPAHA